MASAPPGRTPLWRHAAFLWPLAGAALLALSAPLWWQPISDRLFDLEFALAELLPERAIAGTAWFLLPLVGFGCGLD